MSNDALWDHIAQAITDAGGEAFRPRRRSSVGGGCINSAYTLEGSGQRWFIKVNDASKLEMFEAEAAGLREILDSGAIRAPAPLCSGKAGNSAYLVMEAVDLGRGGQSGAMETFGRQFAAMHRITRPRFGWHRDNTIGSTPQHNTPADDWADFWRRHRLGYQLQLAARHGHTGNLQRQGEALLSRLDQLLAGHSPPASLLHGDLWSGNYGIDAEGRPVIFDPALYFGDREADLAMTELFGGFGARFYAAYRETWPLDPGYPLRRTLYNLYHILNHLNLFGGGYLSQAEHMIASLLSQVR